MDKKLEELEKENKELKKQLKSRKIVIEFNLDDFLYCDKCGAPIDKKGRYNPD